MLRGQRLEKSNVNSRLNLIKAHQTVNQANPIAGNTIRDAIFDITIVRKLSVKTDRNRFPKDDIMNKVLD